MSYNLRIIQEYFQPKVGRRIRIFSLGRKNNILISKKECNRFAFYYLYVWNDNAMFSGQNVYIKIHQTEISLSADKIFLAFIFYLISIYLFFYLNGCCCYMIKGQDLANLLWTEYLAVRVRNAGLTPLAFFLKLIYL